MADSIAKLAIIITGDTSNLDTVMNRAALNMRRWGTEVESSNELTLKMSQAMSAARGNVGAMVSILQRGGMATGITAAAVAAGALAFKLGAISDAQRVLASGGKAGGDSWAGQWDRVEKAAGSIAATLGRPFADFQARETQQIATIMEFIARQILPEELRQEQQKIAILEKQKELIRSQADLKENLVGLTKKEIDQFMRIEKDRSGLAAKAKLQGDKLLGIDRERVAAEMERSRLHAAGLVVPGNIDLAHRPRFRNTDGSISTVRSMSANFDGLEVLIPTISKFGQLLSDSEAIAEFVRTGEHLGKFSTSDAATAYAEQLHRQQEAFYSLSEADSLRRLNAAQRELTLRGQLRVAEEEFGKSQERRMEAMRVSAEALEKSLRGPREQFVASLAEATQLFEAGLITANLYEAAAQQAADKFKDAELTKFKEAVKAKQNAQSQASQGTAAVNRFSMSGFSAVQSGQRELQRLEQVAKDQAAELKRQTEIEQQIANILNEKLGNPVVLMEGNPP